MTKQDVILQISEQTGIDAQISRSVIESFFEVVKDALVEGEPVYIRTFGSFILKQRAQKKARHIRQKTTITVGAHAIPYFKPSSEFSDQVRAQVVPPNKKSGKL